MTPRITLYDISSRLQPQQWSANTLRARLALNHLRLPFETVWLSYPDIAPTLQSLGLPPAHPPPHNTGPAYTLPVIRHEDRFIADSLPIAEYLSSAFPPSSIRPALFPQHSLPLARFVQNYITTSVLRHVRKVILPRVPSILDERGAEYFRRTRKSWLGVPLDQFHANPEEQSRIWSKAIDSMTFLADMLNDNPEGPFLLGSERSYADLIVVAVLHWIRCTDKGRWDEMMSSNNFRALYEACGGLLV